MIQNPTVIPELSSTNSQPDVDQTIPANATTIIYGDPLITPSGVAVIVSSGSLLVLDPYDFRDWQAVQVNSEPTASVDLLSTSNLTITGQPLILDSGIVYALQAGAFLQVAP